MTFLIILSIAAVEFAAWMVWYALCKSGREVPDEPICEPPRSVMGRSKFVLEEGVLRPQAAKIAEAESIAKNAATFAPSKSSDTPDDEPKNAPQYPRQVAPDELNAIFGEPPEGENNDPLEEEQPLYDDEFSEENEADDEEKLPLKGSRNALTTPHAHGLSYENLGEVYRRVVQNPTISQPEKERTGRLLLDLKQTDMFEFLVSGNPAQEGRVEHLIDTCLAALKTRITPSEVAECQSPPTPPQDFSVLNYTGPG